MVSWQRFETISQIIYICEVGRFEIQVTKSKFTSKITESTSNYTYTAALLDVDLVRSQLVFHRTMPIAKNNIVAVKAKALEDLYKWLKEQAEPLQQFCKG